MKGYGSVKLLLKISYLGSAYNGWQVQKDRKTVQKTMQDAVETAFGKRFPITGCSRTDSGVHANMFCCTVEFGDIRTSIPIEKIPVILSRLLPDDISVYDACRVPDSFHPRYDATGKEYIYLIWNGAVKNPFLTERAMFYPKPLDVNLMNEAARCFLGKHNFASFMSSGSKITDTIRRIDTSRVEREGDKIMFTIAGNGFLYNMVRIMAGTLIEAGSGKIAPNDVSEIIRACNRKKAGATAPSCGLYLNRVFY
ncbi:MAG: tRNA pseudouridine(38-40) synthase TruA [Oscillospiraceae bacterium]|jgi:tRNA pseudouridine38-40 synthase|nr:MAG: tRNA pseudouridine(38-40) synthase TruA [Oscillospiraceae bacterium]